jgi:hypothetical protein
MICPKRKDKAGNALGPNESEIESIRGNPVALTTVRLRLSDVSWWMRTLCQKIAMRANKKTRRLGFDRSHAEIGQTRLYTTRLASALGAVGNQYRAMANVDEGFRSHV